MRKIRSLRKSVNLSTKQLSKRLNSIYGCSISNKRLILFECNISKPDKATSEILAEFFNVSIEEIMENAKVNQKTPN